jgi:hypothetical protein
MLSSSSSSSYAKTRTTYRPSTHPMWAKGSKAATATAIQDMQIHIHVMPAPTLAELTAMRDQIVCHTDDLTVWKRTLHAEVMRCTPQPAWMKREPMHPTQHARIAPEQADQLSGILKPETLRRTFISMPALIRQIQGDIVGL